MRILKLWSLVCVLGVLPLAGCSKSSEPAESVTAKMKTPDQVAATMENTFQAVPQEHKTAQVAAEAIKNQDYEAAVVGIQVLQAQPNRTYEQAQVLNQSMRILQGQVIEGLSRGDPKAKRAAELLKARNR